MNEAKARGDKRVGIEIDGKMREVKLNSSAGKRLHEDLQSELDNRKTSVEVAVDLTEGLKEVDAQLYHLHLHIRPINYIFAVFKIY
jgi:hypothetical protein